MPTIARTSGAERPVIERFGEDALLLRFADVIAPDVTERVHAMARQIDARRPAWLLDSVPAYSTLLLVLDLAAFPGRDAQAVAMEWVNQQTFALDSADAAREVEIAVHYGGSDGPDLGDVARHAGLDIQGVIARHSAGRYTVAMLGFAPGFPYLIGLDPALAMSRMDTPRTRVEAGSVGIGGAQTGIYPQPGPGGWRIIGRTRQVLFDATRDPPALLAPGDHVRFVAVAE
jgi:KipI family sensor histidine kinase inhibitor